MFRGLNYYRKPVTVSCIFRRSADKLMKSLAFGMVYRLLRNEEYIVTSIS
ncbi:hypothetical protein Solca_2819 [Solitalea canadensis DSM 3403]|uniref:Uncharacterized protein n=1 Tax=Solitalea canadensis (strain ATCC 29591 / DSM 3403 / JCM 21819 / LMG 8368 / NBRC 15130 / NCIMB 12057 / USAM 9D) TaxID=929556 RepID=H8KS57_SOLCM|nr:hypothetical protein Solca_2819 [Solitalea canadensis DSM 3403]